VIKIKIKTPKSILTVQKIATRRGAAIAYDLRGLLRGHGCLDRGCPTIFAKFARNEVHIESEYIRKQFRISSESLRGRTTCIGVLRSVNDLKRQKWSVHYSQNKPLFRTCFSFAPKLHWGQGTDIKHVPNQFCPFLREDALINAKSIVCVDGLTRCT
jgi:hypothetical protein